MYDLYLAENKMDKKVSFSTYENVLKKHFPFLKFGRLRKDTCNFLSQIRART